MEIEKETYDWNMFLKFGTEIGIWNWIIEIELKFRIMNLKFDLEFILNENKT
jgi:hypothetical protein